MSDDAEVKAAVEHATHVIGRPLTDVERIAAEQAAIKAIDVVFAKLEALYKFPQVPVNASTVDEKPFWLTWNPSHPKTPEVRHGTRNSAMFTARMMAARHANEGAAFYVLKAQSVHQMQLQMCDFMLQPMAAHNQLQPLKMIRSD